MDWPLRNDNFGPPHEWRRFAVPALIALGVNLAALSVLRLPVWKILPHSASQPLQVKLQHPQSAKRKIPEVSAPKIQRPSPVKERATTSPTAPIPKQVPDVERQSKSQSVVTDHRQPVLTRKRLYDTARQVIEAMSEEKAQHVPMGGEIPEMPRQFRHTSTPHKLLSHQWESVDARLYIRDGQCFTGPRLASQAGTEAFSMDVQRFVGTMSIKASAIKCPWDKSSDEPFHFHIHPFKDIHPLKKIDNHPQ
ncbi:MAG TPA: hypothetical protein VFK96_09235 [Gammaproteobacteria bacterium]|nr:hypothetical protein [Gammaproteobacteria bacterium]